MPSIFTIAKEDIKKLNDEKARELVARLAKAECREHNQPESKITWGGNQRAKDGGVDVRADLPKSVSGLDFIQTPCAAFQVKAEQFPPSKVPGEIAPGGKARNVYEDLKSENGTYILVSTKDDCSDSALNERRQKIHETLTEIGFENEFSVDFYCSRRLADWVEKYPSVAIWLRYEIGAPLRGWRPYGAWAYYETDVFAEYLVDDHVRVLTPRSNQPQNVEGAIAELRTSVARRPATRLIGLSGVGKTRLVQALFDERLFPTQAIPSKDNVIYCDLSDDPEPQPGRMLETLLELDADTVVIVDNCSPSEHSRLAQIAIRPTSKIRLLTIEYDIREDDPLETAVYHLEGSSKETIYKLLKRRYGVLSDSDADRIADYSDGNARIAYALANTAENSGDFARLRDADLFARLFHQRKPEDEGLLRSAEAASLLYSFEGEDTSFGSELELLGSIAECTTATFRRHMKELMRRGLLQSRGVWRAVLPHAIANRLAINALEDYGPKPLVAKLFENASPRVARSFCRRIGYLHESRDAVEIAKQLIGSGGQLSEIAKLDDYQEQMFSSLAPLAPDEVLNRIVEAQKDPIFVSTDNRDRSKYIKLARDIAYDPENFKASTNVLLAFAEVEPNNYNKEPACEAFASLFHIIFSGTHATPQQRVSVVAGLLQNGNPARKELGFLALAAALKSTHFTTHFGSDFGSRPRDYGWRPKSHDDVRGWYTTWMKMCREIVRTNLEDAARVRLIVADAFRDLWRVLEIRDDLADLTKEFLEPGSWPEGWRAIKRVLRWDVSDEDKAGVELAQALERQLRPTDLVTEVKARIFAKGTAAFDIEEEDDEDVSSAYRKANEYAENLGERVGNDTTALLEITPYLTSRDYNQTAYAFGKGLGRATADVPGLMSRIRDAIKESDIGSISLIPVCGVISGWSSVDPEAAESFFENAIHDEVWSAWFVQLQVQQDMNEKSFERLMNAVQAGRTPIWQFRYLAGGRATDPFTPEQIGALVSELNKHGQDGCYVAFDLLAMAILCAKEKDASYQYELRRVALAFLTEVDWKQTKRNDGMFDHDIDAVLRFALADGASENVVVAVLSRILENERRPNRYYSFGRLKTLAPFFEFFPRQTLDTICQPDENGDYSTAYVLVTDTFSERRESALSKIPAEVLIEWCDLSPEARYPFAAATCKLFEKLDSEGGNLVISETAISLLRHAPGKITVVRKFIERFRPRSWSGSLADILEHRVPLLRQLRVEGDDEIADAISKAEVEMRRWIDAERKREEDDERRDAGSFE